MNALPSNLLAYQRNKSCPYVLSKRSKEGWGWGGTHPVGDEKTLKLRPCSKYPLIRATIFSPRIFSEIFRELKKIKKKLIIPAYVRFDPCVAIKVSFHVRLEEEFFVAYFALVPHVACVLSLVLLQVMTLAVDFAAIRKLAGEALRLPIANTRHSLTLIFTLLYFQGLFSF